jgi:hypothetical protein
MAVSVACCQRGPQQRRARRPHRSDEEPESALDGVAVQRPALMASAAAWPNETLAAAPDHAAPESIQSRSEAANPAC